MNEESHPQVPVGEFSDEEEWQALCAELARLNEFDAKKDIPRDQATGPLLTFRWVCTVKNGQTVGCVCAFWSTVRKEQGVSLLPDAWTTDPQNVVCSGCLWFGVRFFDVSRAFLHTPIKTRVFAVPPEECQSRIPGGV